MPAQDPWAAIGAVPITSQSSDPWDAIGAVPASAAPAPTAKTAGPPIPQWKDMSPAERQAVVVTRQQASKAQFESNLPKPAQSAPASSSPIPALMSGVDPATFLERLKGAGASIANTMFPSGDTPRPNATLPQLTPQQQVGEKAVTLGAATEGASTLGKTLYEKFVPNAKRAGEMLGALESEFGKTPVDTTVPDKVAGDIETLTRQYGAGRGTPPTGVQKYIDFQTDAGRPMNFSEAKQFASTASNLSTKEFKDRRLNAKVAEFADALRTANRNALPEAMQPIYDAAIQQYASARNLAEKVAIIKKAAKWGLIGAAMGGGAAAAGGAVKSAIGNSLP